MAGLMDVAPSMRKVKIDENDIDVPGISARGIANLIERFPEIRAMFAEREVKLDMAAILKLAPDVVAAVLAAGLGYPGDKAAEERVGRFGIGVQTEILEAVLAVSMPNGIGPLLASVEKLTNLFDAGDRSTKAAATK